MDEGETARYRVGVLGLGRMGAPVAIALSEHHDVTAFDPLPERVRALGSASADHGAGPFPAATLRDAVASVDVLITVLPGAAEFGACTDEIADALPRDALWIDLTSNDPRLAERAAARAEERGVLFVAAPMAGGPDAAEARSLRFTVSGSERAVRQARPLLRHLAAADGIEVVGYRVGDASVAKLLANLLWFHNAAAASEAILLGSALGFDPAALRELLARGAGSSVLLERDFSPVHRGDYRPQFGIDRVVEELDVLTALAAENGVPFDLSSVVARLHRDALARFGAIDGELLVARLLEERSPSTLRSAEGTAGSGGQTHSEGCRP